MVRFWLGQYQHEVEGDQRDHEGQRWLYARSPLLLAFRVCRYVVSQLTILLRKAKLSTLLIAITIIAGELLLSELRAKLFSNASSLDETSSKPGSAKREDQFFIKALSFAESSS